MNQVIYMIDNIFIALAFCTLLTIVIIIIEFIVRKKKLPVSLSRRLIHVFSGLFALFMYFTFTPLIFIACNSLLVVFVGFSFYKKLFKSIHDVPRKTYGEVLLPVATLILYIFWHLEPAIFVPALLVVTLADAAGGIVSDLRAKNRASKLGSLAFFIVSLAILVSTAGVPVYLAFQIAFVITIVEMISPLGSDNATTPLVTALLLSV